MNEEEIRELLNRAGVGENQQKYYTTDKDKIPGLFGFNEFQTGRFNDLMGGFPEFDPSVVADAYDAVDEYGQEKTSDIQNKYNTGRFGLNTSLMGNLGEIRETVGRGFHKFGAKEGLIEGERSVAEETSGELRRQKRTGLLDLEENLGSRRAVIGKSTQNYGTDLMNLASRIFGMDPSSGDGATPKTPGFLKDDLDDEPGFADSISGRYARDQLYGYIETLGIYTSPEDKQKYSNEYAKAYARSGNQLSVNDWWAETYGKTPGTTMGQRSEANIYG